MKNMSRSSDLSSPAVKKPARVARRDPSARRVPLQARAEQTVASLLDAAAQEIADSGYESATLTAVASRAGVSIGSLYQYFPDKPAVARALAERYGSELADQWEPLIGEARVLRLDLLIQRMFDVIFGFQAQRPAFLELLTHAADYRHSKAARSRLRGSMTALLRANQPKLGPEDAVVIAEVVVQIFRGMNRSFEKQPAGQRQVLAKEFNLVLKAYLHSRLTQ